MDNLFCAFSYFCSYFIRLMGINLPMFEFVGILYIEISGTLKVKIKKTLAVITETKTKIKSVQTTRKDRF